MEFVKFARKHLKRRTTTPKKLPTHQLAVALKSTKTVSEVNCLLKYAIYAENYVKPSEIMASIMLKRLVLLIRNHAFQPSVKDWNQMKENVSFLMKAKIPSMKEKWQLAIVLVIIKIHCEENDHDDVKFQSWTSNLYKSNKWGIQFTEDKGRHVFAKSDIEVGEIVSIDQVPLFKLLYDPLLGKEENGQGSTKLQTSLVRANFHKCNVKC